MPLVVLLVTIGGGAHLLDAVDRASWASLGRDQGIFQYIAWAVGQGDVAYRDVRDVNGPLIPLIHLLLQALGGTDEHVFRVLDLAIGSVLFAGAGAALAEPRSPGAARGPAVLRAAAWGAAAWAVLVVQYVGYGFWDTAQRESFLDWFVLASIAVQLRGGPVMLVAALSTLPWLGKPTYLLFTLPQVAAVALEPGPARLRRLRDFALGGALGLAVPGAFLALRGDPRAFLRISLVDVPTMYRFIWPRPALAILTTPGYDRLALAAGVTSLALLVAIVLRALPLRALPAALLPVLGLVSVVAQAKGFAYHFHPVTLGTAFGWLVGLAALVRAGRPVPLGLALAGAVALGQHAALVGARASDPPGRGFDRARLAAFDRVDFFPNGLRDAAAYVAARTGPEDRVQTYGMDPYLLFLARRRSATPYVYAYDLNVDAALHGSFEPGGLVPTAAQRAAISALRQAHVADLGERLRAAPPKAFVLLDRSPLMTVPDALEDLETQCPEVVTWLRDGYREAAAFEGIRVWLRNDVPDGDGKVE